MPKPEEHFSDFHILAVIREICEQSILRTPAGKNTARRIMRIVAPAIAGQLGAYDAARSKDTTHD
jgi:hypothetical protein